MEGITLGEVVQLKAVGGSLTPNGGTSKLSHPGDLEFSWAWENH